MRNETQTEVAARCTRAASRPFETKGGARIKAEFLTADGEEVAVFADAASMMSKCMKGDKVILHKGLKGLVFSAFDFAAQAAAVQPPGPAAEQQVSGSAGRKKEIAAYIGKQVKCFAYCYTQVSEDPQLSELLDADRRTIATTIYIQACKKFSL